MAEPEIRRGKIRKINTEKGFGFIQADDGKEYFVHSSKCRPGVFARLTEGAEVTFTEKTPAAFDVDLVEG